RWDEWVEINRLLKPNESNRTLQKELKELAKGNPQNNAKRIKQSDVRKKKDMIDLNQPVPIPTENEDPSNPIEENPVALDESKFQIDLPIQIKTRLLEDFDFISQKYVILLFYYNSLFYFIFIIFLLYCK